MRFILTLIDVCINVIDELYNEAHGHRIVAAKFKLVLKGNFE